jgi:hypothetical protein
MGVPLNDSLNLATNTRWMAVIPFYQIDDSFKTGDVAFNLATFSLPEMSIGSTTVGYHGYEVEIPNFVRSGDKTVTFDYLMSSDWHQYLLLWQWANKIAKAPGSGTEEGVKNLGDISVPIRFYALSEFRKPIFEIVYNNCWIKDFGGISVDYQDSESSVILHSFTCAYTDFELIPHALINK